MLPADEPSRLRILVVDDDEDTVLTLRDMLSTWGHDVRYARSGKDALDQYERWIPDAVVTDIALPDMVGYEIARKVRSRPEGAGRLLVSISGFARYVEDLSRKAGFNEHFRKPADLVALRTLLGSWRPTSGAQ
jgi:CheY-like chemotaxis protein